MSDQNRRNPKEDSTMPAFARGDVQKIFTSEMSVPSPITPETQSLRLNNLQRYLATPHNDSERQ